RATAEALGRETTGHARRDADGAARPAPTNLCLRAGDGSVDDLVAAVDEGMLLEGPLAGRCDPVTWRGELQVARAREIRRGKLTGRLYGPALLHGDVVALLGATRLVSADRASLAAGADASAVAPAVLTRGAIASP